MSENPAESVARRYFESEKVVSHYFHEGHRVGLWESEKKLFASVFSKQDRILDLGCGTGRIAFGLEKLGFRSVMGADYSAKMIEGARLIAEGTDSSVTFLQADARQMPFAADTFDSVIFGFNGFFMIPGHKERMKALNEIHRILKMGGCFIFTGHDRNLRNQRDHWQEKALRMRREVADTTSEDFGDVVAETEWGTMFIHSTTEEDVADLLNSSGFSNVETWLRSELGNEGAMVRAFSDECRFWKATKIN